MTRFAAQIADLHDLDARARRRRLAPRIGIDFASNDYLGLTGDARLRAAVADALARGVPIGAGGSRLLRGNDPEHGALEEEAARFFGAPAALFMANGFVANLALFGALPRPGDLILYDALVHASTHDGMHHSHAEHRAFRHNDPDDAAAVIANWRSAGKRGRIWIAIESLYGMDGDRAPLDALVDLANRHDAILIIDEAHATGVFGPAGRGLADHLTGHEGVIILHTCGKAMGCEGALVTGAEIVRDSLIARARPFIFSTAPSPLMAAAVRAALHILASEPERIVRLHRLVDHAARVLGPVGATVSGSPIMPLIVGDDALAMDLAARVQAMGFDVRGIRPPTVPTGTARLRLSITLNAGAGDIDRLADALGTLR